MGRKGWAALPVPKWQDHISEVNNNVQKMFQGITQNRRGGRQRNLRDEKA